jgi:SMC interacting uncharacterized protein involved in chromosome segregation
LQTIRGVEMSDKCSCRGSPVTPYAAGNLKDLRQKIAYRNERISHLQSEIDQRHDQIQIMECEISEFKAMLDKEAK